MTNTVKVKTANLDGIALDWAVAYCGGIKVIRCGAGKYQYLAYIPKRSAYKKYSPSTNWVQGGPIIERELIDVFSMANGKGWCAQSDVRVFNGYGPTPLISAMRCFCCSKLGDEVEIPKELTWHQNHS